MTYHVVLFDGTAHHFYSGSKKTAERGAERLAHEKYFKYCTQMAINRSEPLSYERWRSQHRIEIAPVTLDEPLKTA